MTRDFPLTHNTYLDLQEHEESRLAAARKALTEAQASKGVDRKQLIADAEQRLAARLVLVNYVAARVVATTPLASLTATSPNQIDAAPASAGAIR